MPTAVMAYRVLIASPSDVRDERNAVEATILRWNAANAHTGVILIPVRWERDAIPAMGGEPQDILNQQIVDECDLGIGIFWERMGTPTANAISGTVEEIQRLQEQQKRVMLYFSRRPSSQGADPAQVAAVAQFRQECHAIYQLYDDAADLSLSVFQHLSAVIPQLVSTDGRAAFARHSASAETKLATLAHTDIGRPEFEVAIAAVRRSPSKFTPEFRVRQVSGATVPQFEWQMSAAGLPGGWQTTLASDVERTHFIGKFDLNEEQPILVSDLWLHIRFVWDGLWYHERHRWPLRRTQGLGKALIELDPEVLPPQYWTSNSPHDLVPVLT